jgi:hypothetical protein
MENEPAPESAPEVVKKSVDARISALEKGQADIATQIEKILTSLTPPAPAARPEEKPKLEPSEPSRPFWANFF